MSYVDIQEVIHFQEWYEFKELKHFLYDLSKRKPKLTSNDQRSWVFASLNSLTVTYN